MHLPDPADPIAAVIHPDPYAYYGRLAAMPPFRHERLGLWIVAHPAHVAELLAHPAARVVLPPGAPAGFAGYARFTDGPAHERARADVVARVAAATPLEPPIALDDLDAFIECYAVFALARDLGANVRGDILFQSYDATRGLIGNAFAASARDASLDAEAAVDHAVAHDPPVHNTRRALAEDAEIGGVRIPGGETALAILVGGTFGSGRHACPGDALARRIAAMALHRLRAAGIAPRAPLRYLDRPNVRIPLFEPGGTAASAG